VIPERFGLSKESCAPAETIELARP